MNADRIENKPVLVIEHDASTTADKLRACVQTSANGSTLFRGGKEIASRTEQLGSDNTKIAVTDFKAGTLNMEKREGEPGYLIVSENGSKSRIVKGTLQFEFVDVVFKNLNFNAPECKKS